VDFFLDITSDNVEAVLVNNADEEGLKALAEEGMSFYKDSHPVRIAARANSAPDVVFDTAQLKKYQKLWAPLDGRFQSGDLHYCLTIIPTPSDAELDGMEYEEYMCLFFEASDQPWDEIEKAQEKLIEKLDQGKEIRITNDDGTDLTFNIEGQTFANSVTLKNVPGSEAFTGPVRERVNGTLVAKGRFKFGNYQIMEDITLKFKDGRVCECDARVGREVLEKIVTMDDGNGEGTRFAGELGIGTNPHLRKHLMNSLLVEKIGGSFHIALGTAYQYERYNDRPVKVDNGNRSASGTHWDITTILGGKGGRMILDGKVIQKNGVWVGEDEETPDEELAVLNKGWGALPEENQPDWWKNRYPQGYATEV